MSGVLIRSMTTADWAAVESIYREGIATGNATFETDPPTWGQPSTQGNSPSGGSLPRTPPVRSSEGSPPHPCHLARCTAALSSTRYVAHEARGHGVGAALLDAFLQAADSAGIWTMQSSIFPENPASLALHDRAGFRGVGHRERIALMTYGPWTGQWRDTILVKRRHPR